MLSLTMNFSQLSFYDQLSFIWVSVLEYIWNIGSWALLSEIYTCNWSFDLEKLVLGDRKKQK